MMGKVNGKILWKLIFSFSLILPKSIRTVSSERILFLLPLSMKSHRIFFEPLINGLATKGHDVTVLTNGMSNSSPDVLNSNVKELVTMQKADFMKGYPEPFENMKIGSGRMVFPFDFILGGCHKVIQSQAFRGVLRRSKEFDLIIVDSFLTGCLDGFIYKSKVPFILVTTMPAPSYISERVGNFLPPSIIPVLSYNGYEEFNGKMGFWQRLENFAHFMLARIYVNLVILPSLEKVYREYLGDEVPGILEIESKLSRLDVCTVEKEHAQPRKILQNIFTLEALEQFISKEASPHGFIYFSVGSMIDLDNAPAEFIHALLTTFSRLEQRVVLKWKRRKGKKVPSNSTRELPKNVWIGDWFSQQDILSHENIRLFISHGGLLSMQEAVYHGVPVLGVPFGLDQDTNLRNAVLQGYALKVDVNGLSEASLNFSINEILTDGRFLDNAQRISQMFRQRPISPLETALFWSEYVMLANKHNNTDYMGSPARQMSIFQYYSYDILTFLLISSIAVVYTMRRSLLVIFKLIKVEKGATSSCTTHHKKVA